MGKLAFVFSGQGAQYPGMGQDLYKNYEAAQGIFDLAEALRPGTMEQCFAGSKQELAQTANTQPCLFCVSLAAANCLKAFGIEPDVLAGFSMGEITALTAGGVFGTKEGFKLICLRGRLMQEAALQQPSAMLAVLKLSADQVEGLCGQFDQVYPVNYNCPGQTVVALAQNQLAGFTEAVLAHGGKTLALAVSGGFHSPFMAEAKTGLDKALSKIACQAPVLPIYANSTALPYEASEAAIKETVARQVMQPVQWQGSIENMLAVGVDTFIEVGPGKTLTNLIKKISPGAAAFNVEDSASLLAAAAHCSHRAG